MNTRNLMALVLVAVLSAATLASASAQNLRVYVDGQVLATTAPPVEIGGRVLVGMRDIFERLGAEVQWNPANQQITATGGGRMVALWIGQPSAMVNGTMLPLDVPPRLIGGSTYVPVRFVSEALGANVTWMSQALTVLITTSTSVVPETGGTTEQETPPTPAETVVTVRGVFQAAQGASISLIPYDTGAVDIFAMAPAATIQRGPAAGDLQPVALTDLRPGDDVTATLAGAQIAALQARHETVAAIFQAAATRSLLTQDGTVYRMSEMLALPTLRPGQPITLYVNPQDRLVWGIDAGAAPAPTGQLAIIEPLNGTQVTLPLTVRGTASPNDMVTYGVGYVIKDGDSLAMSSVVPQKVQADANGAWSVVVPAGATTPFRIDISCSDSYNRHIGIQVFPQPATVAELPVEIVEPADGAKVPATFILKGAATPGLKLTLDGNWGPVRENPPAGAYFWPPQELPVNADGTWAVELTAPWDPGVEWLKIQAGQNHADGRWEASEVTVYPEAVAEARLVITEPAEGAEVRTRFLVKGTGIQNRKVTYTARWEPAGAATPGDRTFDQGEVEVGQDGVWAFELDTRAIRNQIQDGTVDRVVVNCTLVGRGGAIVGQAAVTVRPRHRVQAELKIAEPADGAKVDPTFTLAGTGIPGGEVRYIASWPAPEGVVGNMTGLMTVKIKDDGTWSDELQIGDHESLTMSCTMLDTAGEAVGDAKITVYPKAPRFTIDEPKTGSTVRSRFTLSGTGLPDREVTYNVRWEPAPGGVNNVLYADQAAKVGQDGTWSAQIDARSIEALILSGVAKNLVISAKQAGRGGRLVDEKQIEVRLRRLP